MKSKTVKYVCINDNSYVLRPRYECACGELRVSNRATKRLIERWICDCGRRDVVMWNWDTRFGEEFAF